MADPSLHRLRVTFSKSGRLALLSHLELTHALERAVRRANLPFAVTQGFSPHMRIAFGAALPVGVGGSEEIFDLFLTEYIKPEVVLELLKQNSVPDLMCLDCRYIAHKDPAASVAYPFSTYVAELSFAPDCLPIPETITLVRKKKEKQLHPEEFVVGDMALMGQHLRFTLEFKQTGSLRPDALLEACFEQFALPEADRAPIWKTVPNLTGGLSAADAAAGEGEGAGEGTNPAQAEPLHFTGMMRISQKAQMD